MERRQFVRLSGVALGGLALEACTRATSLHAASTPAPAPVDAAAFTRARRYASTPFGEIAYVEQGRGPAALFIHGYPLNGFQWRDVMPRLAGVRRCIAPDLMGLGYSTIAATQRITPETQVSMLLALLDALHVDACDVLGNDSGGMIAQVLVMRAPNRVRSLLLTNCDTEHDCPPPSFLPFVRLAQVGGLADKTIAPALANKAAARGPRGLGGIGYANPLNPTDEAIDMYFTPIVSSAKRKAQYDVLTVGLGKNALANSAALLGQYTGPVRIVWGANDTVFAQSSPAWLDQIFPRSRGVRLVEGAKLFFPEEQPDVIASEARSLWTAVVRRR